MESLLDKLEKHIKKTRKTSIFLPTDFLDLGNRNAIDQALYRLVKKGIIRRIAQGLYIRPQYSELLQTELLPTAHEVVNAIAKRENRIVQPSAALAANMLGLSLQVPAKMTYITNGTAKKIKVGEMLIEFKPVATKAIVGAGSISGLVVQALKYLGKHNIDDEVTNRLFRILKKQDKKELLQTIRFVPAWMRPTIEAITKEEGE